MKDLSIFNKLLNFLLIDRSAFSLQSLKTIIFLSFFLILPGCYISGSVTSLDSDSGAVKLDKSNGADFVSGSAQYELTQLRRYKTMSAVGSFNKEVLATTPHGYKVYSSVQGAIFSSRKGSK